MISLVKLPTSLIHTRVCVNWLTDTRGYQFIKWKHLFLRTVWGFLAFRTVGRQCLTVERQR